MIVHIYKRNIIKANSQYIGSSWAVENVLPESYHSEPGQGAEQGGQLTEQVVVQ